MLLAQAGISSRFANFIDNFFDNICLWIYGQVVFRVIQLQLFLNYIHTYVMASMFDTTTHKHLRHQMKRR